MAEEFSTEKVEGGFALSRAGRTLVMLRGEDGALAAEAAPGALTDDKMECFKKCFENPGGTLGDSKRCAKQCGLE